MALAVLRYGDRNTKVVYLDEVSNREWIGAVTSVIATRAKKASTVSSENYIHVRWNPKSKKDV